MPTDDERIIALLPNLTVRVVSTDRFGKTRLAFHNWSETNYAVVYVTVERIIEIYQKAVELERVGLAEDTAEVESLFALDTHNTVRVLSHHLFGVDISFRGFAGGWSYQFSVLPEHLRAILDIAGQIAALEEMTTGQGIDNLPF